MDKNNFINRFTYEEYHNEDDNEQQLIDEKIERDTDREQEKIAVDLFCINR